MLDVYAARERPEGELAGVSGLTVAEAAADAAPGPPGALAGRRRAGRRTRSSAELGEGDLLVTLGAGDVFRLADRLVAGEGAP